MTRGAPTELTGPERYATGEQHQRVRKQKRATRAPVQFTTEPKHPRAAISDFGRVLQSAIERKPGGAR